MLEVEGVSKRFDPPPWWLRPLARVASTSPVTALRDVSLEVRAGEVVGLIGANGAGKTTLLSIIAALIEPTSGRVRIDGFDPVHQSREVRSRIGIVLADDRGFYWRLSGRLNLEFFGVLSGLPPRDAARRAGHLLEEVGLAHRDRMVFGYSSGMITRLHIARALMTEPPLLLLDEPTRSLDPVVSTEVLRLVRQRAGQGQAVLMTSHSLEEVVSVCDRIVMLRDGMIARTDTPSDLRARGGVSVLREALESVAR